MKEEILSRDKSNSMFHYIEVCPIEGIGLRPFFLLSLTMYFVVGVLKQKTVMV